MSAPRLARAEAAARALPAALPPRSRVGARSNTLFLLPWPFLVAALRAEPAGLALNLAAFGALMGAAWLTREGLRAQEAFDARRTARRPALPRKTLGAALTGAGLAAAGLADGAGLAAVLYAVLGAGLHLVAFGPDPMADKGLDAAGRFEADRAARAVADAESVLDEMHAAAVRTGDRALAERVETFAGTARAMFEAVADDPRDLPAARRWLGVYLAGARDAVVKYADLAPGSRDGAARADLMALLDDLEANYAARTERLLAEDRGALEVEIEVLRDRLAREAARHDRETPDA